MSVEDKGLKGRGSSDALEGKFKNRFNWQQAHYNGLCVERVLLCARKLNLRPPVSAATIIVT